MTETELEREQLRLLGVGREDSAGDLGEALRLRKSNWRRLKALRIEDYTSIEIPWE